ncbi:MAG: hypothetical protein ACK4NS_06200 [Saprospiraceae bacterium]
MSKKVPTLDEIKLKGFATVLDADLQQHIKGGYVTVKGKRFTYRTRWTSVDTRAELSEFSGSGADSGGGSGGN